MYCLQRIAVFWGGDYQSPTLFTVRWARTIFIYIQALCIPLHQFSSDRWSALYMTDDLPSSSGWPVRSVIIYDLPSRNRWPAHLNISSSHLQWYLTFFNSENQVLQVSHDSLMIINSFCHWLSLHWTIWQLTPIGDVVLSLLCPYLSKYSLGKHYQLCQLCDVYRPGKMPSLR